VRRTQLLRTIERMIPWSSSAVEILAAGLLAGQLAAV
jgi:hypothetical protein